MVARTDLAWRILQIAALALPALAILVQVLLEMDHREISSTPHYYQVSVAMLFLLVPMTSVGIITSGVLFFSYEVTWLRWVTALMAISFLFVPLFLIGEFRGNHKLFKNQFLEREKEAIREASDSSEMSGDDAEDEIERIKSWQGGILSWLSWRSEQLNNFYQQHPKLDLAIHGAMLIWWVYVIASGQGILMTALGFPVVLYAVAHIGSHFVDIPIEEYE